MTVITAGDDSYDLSTMTRQELIDLKAKLLEEKAIIKQKLSNAIAIQRKTGNYSDPEWWSRANGAARFRGSCVQNIDAELSRRKGQKKQSFEKVFMDIAYDVLDAKTYKQIETAARAEVEDEW
jgi:hypothetical protein